MGNDDNEDLHELEENAELASSAAGDTFLRKLKRADQETEASSNYVGVGKLISSSAMSWLGFFRVNMF